MPPRFLLWLVAFASLPGCLGPWNTAWNLDSETDVETDTETDADTDTDSDSDSDSDTDADTDSDTDTGEDTDIEPPDIVTITGTITSNTTWSKNHIYQLSGVVFVDPNVTLTIEAGTTIQGLAGDGSPGTAGALIVSPDAKLYAVGNKDEPIVFTSAKPVGTRVAGDWAGVALLGKAPVNKPAARLEGISEADPRGLFGGIDPTYNCGTLKYVRIEFAGYAIASGKELNSLTLAGCGYQTTVENVQTHQGLDDGIEIFGGTVNIRQVVISRVDDDSLDWDNGWQGYAQFVIIQQEPGLNPVDGVTPNADAGFEADNNDPAIDPDFLLEPRSNPTIWNVTMLGSKDPQSAPLTMNLRRGTAGKFGNLLIAGYAKGSIDIRDAKTVEQIEAGAMTFDSALLWDIGSGGTTYFENEPTDGSSGDDDGGFSEPTYFNDAERNFTFTDPLLPLDAFSLVAPNFKPDIASPAGDSDNVGTPPTDAQGFFRDATYLGAVNPAATVLWYDGWTAFPEN